MGKRVFFSLAVTVCMLFGVMATALTGHAMLHNENLAEWMSLPRHEKLASLEALAMKHRAKLSLGSLESCIEAQATTPGFAAYSVAASYSTCVFKLSN